jgi:formiminoglutamase
LGYVEADRAVSIINLDAHLDVRELPEGRATSGTPFRQALEHPSGILGGRYVCLGAQPYANSPAYIDYVASKGGSIEWFEQVRAEGVEAALGHQLGRHPEGGVMVSFDMDAVSSAFAPGASAASPEGFSAEEFLLAARKAGQSRATTSFEISEVAPALDRDNQTARLAALAVWRFLRARLQSLNS